MSSGIALSLVALAGLALLWRRDQRRLRRERARFFDDCLSLFEAHRVTQDAPAFPVLEGTCRGLRVSLKPFVDDLTWRKLPCLWLQMTVFCDQPFGATLDVMARPRGTEVFSPAADLPFAVALPLGWPRDMAIRTDAPQRAPPLAVVEPHIGLFDDPRAKELVITPRGVRLVTLVAEAQRANYAVLRQIDLGGARLERTTVDRYLNAALALAADLASPASAQRAA